MLRANKISDFDPTQFTIFGFCDSCDHQAPVPTDRDLEIPRLIRQLRCRECGSGDCSIRIVYTAANLSTLEHVQGG